MLDRADSLSKHSSSKKNNLSNEPSESDAWQMKHLTNFLFIDDKMKHTEVYT